MKEKKTIVNKDVDVVETNRTLINLKGIEIYGVMKATEV
jgi:hypothetical protein